jgi:hypothetical protein
MRALRRHPRATALAICAAFICAWLIVVTLLVLGPVGAAARHLPGLLGLLGPRTWLVLLQNPAESRGTGGLVGGYLVVRADRGTFRVLASGTSADLARHSIPLTDADPAQVAFWGPILTQWNGFNVTPDFPVAASLARTGMQALAADAGADISIDGGIAVDPFTVSALMDSIGSVAAAGRTVSATTVARYYLIHEYLDFTSGADRDGAGMALARAILDRVTSSPAALAAALPRVPSLIQAGHLRAWSARPDEQAWLASTTLGGAVVDTPGPHVAIAFNNAAGNKADAFVTTSVDYEVATCGTAGTWPARLVITARNDMPRGLPLKDYGRRDVTGAAPSSTALLVHVFAPRGAAEPVVMLNGHPSTMTFDALGSRPVWWATLDLPRGTPVTLAITFREPTSPDATPTVQVTPMAHPTIVTSTLHTDCP